MPMFQILSVWLMAYSFRVVDAVVKKPQNADVALVMFSKMAQPSNASSIYIISFANCLKIKYFSNFKRSFLINSKF